MSVRYCWINANGDFSESWDEETHENNVDETVMKRANEQGAKLIKYECPNDEEFEFNSNMALLN